MIPASLYQLLFCLVISIMTFVSLDKFRLGVDGYLHGGKSVFPAEVLFVLLLILFIGFRPIDRTFVDMYDYNMTWMFYEGDYFEFVWDTDNKIFDNLFMWMSSMSWNVYSLFLLMSATYFGCIYCSSRILFRENHWIAFLVYLAAFSTFSYATNGIKAGAGAALFLMAIAFNHKENTLLTFIFLLLSLGFHHSMILPCTAFVLCKFVKNPKVFFAGWGFCFIVALFHITFFQSLFAGMADEHGATYLVTGGEHVKENMMGGFRIDFIIYSVVPVIVGWYAINKKNIQSLQYNFLLNLYITINAVWLLCMYAEFTNRIAYLSWLMYPFVLIYPFLNEKWGKGQYRLFRKVVLFHLAFTLFMFFVYYA